MQRIWHAAMGKVFILYLTSTVELKKFFKYFRYPAFIIHCALTLSLITFLSIYQFIFVSRPSCIATRPANKGVYVCCCFGNFCNSNFSVELEPSVTTNGKYI